MDGHFTHLDGRGNARMVDVSNKTPTRRRAVARCRVLWPTGETSRLDAASATEAAPAARVAGVQAAKRTSTLIPLCHPLPLGDVTVEIAVALEAAEIRATAETFERTGVEMEALTACAFAGLTVVGAIAERGSTAVLDGLALWEKTGGRSGTWRRAQGSSVRSRT